MHVLKKRKIVKNVYGALFVCKMSSCEKNEQARLAY